MISVKQLIIATQNQANMEALTVNSYSRSTKKSTKKSTILPLFVPIVNKNVILINREKPLQ